MGFQDSFPPPKAARHQYETDFAGHLFRGHSETQNDQGTDPSVVVSLSSNVL